MERIWVLRMPPGMGGGWCFGARCRALTELGIIYVFGPGALPRADICSAFSAVLRVGRVARMGWDVLRHGPANGCRTVAPRRMMGELVFFDN